MKVCWEIGGTKKKEVNQALHGAEVKVGNMLGASKLKHSKTRS